MFRFFRFVALWSFAVIVASGVEPFVPHAHAQLTPTSVSYMRFYDSMANFAARGAAIAEANPLSVGRVAAWAGYVGIGLTVAGIVIHALNGDVGIQTRGQADANRSAVSNAPPPPPYIWEWRSGMWNGHPGQNAVDVVPEFCASIGYGVHTNQASSNGTSTTHWDMYCSWYTQGAWYGTTLIKSWTCAVGATVWRTYDAYPNPGVGCPATESPPATGGTESWAPRTWTNPTTGDQVTGWEQPTDPAVQPQPFNPAQPMEMPADDHGVKPVVIVTANPDGGYTVQTWAPQYTTVNNTTTQNGWTVQTTTINNAGQVTNTTIVVTNTGTPPASGSGQPTSDGSSNPAQNPPPAVQCGSLSCESTQQSVLTQQQGIHSDTSTIKDNTTQMKTDVGSIKTDVSAIKQSLDTTGAPDLPDQSGAIQAAKDADKAKSDELSQQIQSDALPQIAHDSGALPRWVFTPPVGSCTAPTATLGLAHVTASFDYCPIVGSINEAIGWLFAVLATWDMWNTLTRKNED